MIRLLLPLFPFRLAGIMVSSGWAGWSWWAVSLYLGGNRIMLHISPRGVRVLRVKQRYSAASDFSLPVVIRHGRVRNA